MATFLLYINFLEFWSVLPHMSNDVESVRSVLRKRNLEKLVEGAFLAMRIVQRQVRGSEAEKDHLLPKFLGLRIWCGCSSLFLTLNPHDIRSPLSLIFLYLQNDVTFERKISLDWGDAETDAYIESLLKDALHEIGRKILHRLISSTNRRMHKGFPEMLTYLLNKPMEYCSHMFVHVQYDTLYRVLYAIILARNENARLEEQPLTVPVSRKA